MKEEPPSYFLPIMGLIVWLCFHPFLLAYQSGSHEESQIQQIAQTADLTNESYQIIDGAYLRATIRSPDPIRDWEWEDIGWRTVTGYSSTIEECGDDPFTTASGEKVRHGIIATNEFPFGTMLLIDGKVYEVKDRTHEKYDYLIDIWFETKEEALAWGKRSLAIKKAIRTN
jgi:3D (Asp-Asp-Asp) domain-containing protein